MANLLRDGYRSGGFLWLMIFVVMFVAIVVGLYTLSGLIIMLLWNALVPALITSGSTITYWQGILISIVLTIVGRVFRGK